MKQIHKRFDSHQVKELLSKYEQGVIERKSVEEMLCIGKAQFFRLLKQYRKEKEHFSIEYRRDSVNRQITSGQEELILKGLKEQKELILNPYTPAHKYNYANLSETLERKYCLKVSVPTIINRAKQWGYYKSAIKSKKARDRVVYTNNIGELIQHDSSYHLFAPFACKKWYLINKHR
jgi:hypothetical protein